LSSIVLSLGFLFIAYLSWQAWPLLTSQAAQARWSLFTISALLGMTSILITAWYFYKLLEKFQGALPQRLCLNMFYFSLIAKYIPGKIWTLVSQRLLSQGQVSRASIILANLELTATQINNTLCVGVTLLLFLYHQYALLVSITIIAAITCYSLSVSCAMHKLSGKFLSVLRKTKRFRDLNLAGLHCHPRFSKFGLTVFFIASLIGFAASHFFMLLSLFSLDIDSALFYTALLALSWIIGVITLISPAGMGIRELIFIVLAQLSSQQVDQQLLAAIAVVSRLWIIAYEITSVALLFLVNKYFPAQPTASLDA